MRLHGLESAIVGNPYVHEDVRMIELTSAAHPESIVGNPCDHPGARRIELTTATHPEPTATETGDDSTGDDCCEVPPILPPRPTRATRKMMAGKLKARIS